MTLYTLHDLSLEVQPDELETQAALVPLLHDLSFVRHLAGATTPSLRLYVHLRPHALRAPRTARVVFSAEGLWGLEEREHFYLTEGSSLLHLQVSHGQGEAQLAPTFFRQPLLLRQRFWACGLLKLLRPLGCYGLHAAGVVTPTGQGLLIVGGSGGGKSTLAIGLLRHGWGYLSDDAVLLRHRPEGVEALALRQPFSLEAPAAAAYPDLPLGEAGPHPSAGGRKRRVDIRETYGEQYVPRCLPQVLLVAQVVPNAPSTLRPLEAPRALWHLLAQSGPPLFDRRTMPHHLEVLKGLVQQTATYELRAGSDLQCHPRRLVEMLATMEGVERWPAW